MSEAKFTKGQWAHSHRKKSDGTYSTEVYDERGETICVLAWHTVDYGDGVISTDRQENAQLISTAPDLYEEIEQECAALIQEIQNLDVCSENDERKLAGLISKAKRKEALLAKARGDL